MHQPVDSSPIPDDLTDTEQWVCWQEETRDGQDKPTKVPVDPDSGGYASVADPDTWTDFTAAYQHYRGHDGVAGIGFVFTETDPYVGVDLDDCRDPDTGQLTEWAKDIVRRLDSYTEASPSGTGVHVIIRGDLPDTAGNRNDDVELYDRDRYFTVTGRHLSLTPGTVNERTDVLEAVHEEYVVLTESDSGNTAEPTQALPESTDTADLPDDELIEYAMEASNGDKFQRLWRGDTSDYPSHSEADLALCNLLAYWTGGDPQQIERLFNQSGLTREKWNDRADYRKRTIQTAIDDCPAYYDTDNGGSNHD